MTSLSLPSQGVPSDGVKFDRHGIHALFVQGSSYDMAFQHGTLLHDEIPNGAISISSKLISNEAHNELPDNPILANLLTKSIRLFISDRIAKYVETNYPDLSELYSDSMRGMSESSGVSEEELRDAAVAPDVLMVVAKVAMKLGSFQAAASSLGSNCSSFAAWGDYTSDGRLLIGRNLDFPVTGGFDKYPTLIYATPNDGQKYLVISSAGLHIAGLTSINESGIYIACHTVPTTEASANGIPPFMTAVNVMKNARTFDEAVAIFKGSLPPSGWAYDLASFKEGRVATLELSNQHMAVRESGLAVGKHIQTNDYLMPEMAGLELYINRSVVDDAAGRYQRLDQLIEQNKGKITPNVAATFLGDQVDVFSNQVHGLGNTVSVHTTVGSVVVDPKAGLVYVASGEAPAPYHHYFSFPLPGNVDATTFESSPDLELSGAEFSKNYPALAQAELKFLEAKEDYEYQNDSDSAFQAMKEAVALDTTSPHYFFVEAIYALRSGHSDDAQIALRKVLEVASQTHQTDLAHYYLGRLAADQGNEAVALAELSQVGSWVGSDAKLKAAATKAITDFEQKGTLPLKTSNLPLMVQQADLQAY